MSEERQIRKDLTTSHNTQGQARWALLLAQRGHRIYPARSTRRYKTGELRGNDKDGDGDSKSRYVSGRHSLYQAIEDTPRGQSRKKAHSNTDEDHHEALYQPRHIQGIRASVIRIGTRRALGSLADDPPVPSSNAVCCQLDRELRAAFVSISRVL
jgi:hypothetical protein